MGTTFVTRTVRDTGADPAEVVRAFVVVDALARARDLAARAAGIRRFEPSELRAWLQRIGFADYEDTVTVFAG